jgi:hypothetical protein
MSEIKMEIKGEPLLWRGRGRKKENERSMCVRGNGQDRKGDLGSHSCGG